MKIEFVKSEVLGNEEFVELAPGVYQRNDGAVLILAQDGTSAALVQNKSTDTP